MALQHGVDRLIEQEVIMGFGADSACGGWAMAVSVFVFLEIAQAQGSAVDARLGTAPKSVVEAYMMDPTLRSPLPDHCRNSYYLGQVINHIGGRSLGIPSTTTSLVLATASPPTCHVLHGGMRCWM